MAQSIREALLSVKLGAVLSACSTRNMLMGFCGSWVPVQDSPLQLLFSQKSSAPISEDSLPSFLGCLTILIPAEKLAYNF